MRRDVSQGESLHTALARHPRRFDALFCNLVRAAEQAGMLDTMLERIAVYREKSLALKGKVRSALAYPCTVVLVALVVTMVIMLWVVPAFEQMFHNFGAELPLPTRIVMETSRLLGRFWPWLLAVLAISAVLGMQAWQRSERLRMQAQRASLRLPLFGRLLRQAALARWSRTFGTLFGAGIALVEALETVAGAAGNVVYAEASLAIRDAVRNGASLHAAMEATGVFPDLAVQMAAVGEEAGALDAMLGKIDLLPNLVRE
ncbi:MAG: putative type II secretion system protein F [Herbaspirillum frisingense]|uniref:Putative type II secretion system protein F n=1 Tax=Herbaspirillum frisingense TaxID=92645 RepID=A0A7V8JSL0_9BURK|nr:MAG: putative type II secretion system protein F [Herbaspirillum frisingense]